MHTHTHTHTHTYPPLPFSALQGELQHNLHQVNSYHDAVTAEDAATVNTVTEQPLVDDDDA